MTDPNSYLITQGSRNMTIPGGSQGIDCEARWYRGESPLGRTWPCNSIENGHWAMQLLPGTSGSSVSESDFTLRLIHAVEPGLSYANTRYEAEASFRSGDNLGGRCLSSGGCNWGLSSDCKYPSYLSRRGSVLTRLCCSQTDVSSREKDALNDSVI